MPTYDPQKNSIVVNKKTIAGFGGSTFLKASRNEDLWTLVVGADGQWCRVKNANKSGILEITLLQSSPANDVLAAMVNTDEQQGNNAGAVAFKDASGTAVASGPVGWVKKVADIERGKELSESVWQIEVPELTLVPGSNTDSP